MVPYVRELSDPDRTRP